MLRLLLIALVTLFRSRADMALENLALRQQLAVFKHRKPRPRLSAGDRLFWVALSKLWSKWQQVLVLVQPETVVRWHRLGFRAFWRWRSRPQNLGRPKIDQGLRDLIRRLAKENPTWGAPRIHAELLLLGFDFAERTISRYLPRQPTSPETLRRWKTFLKLHQEAIAAMDFFTVPTITFQVLYVFVVLHHHRRRILYWAVTHCPSTEWIRQQLRQAFPFDSTPRYLIFDRDSLFDQSVVQCFKNLGGKPVRTARKSPWQNGFVERWVGSVRREILDHVIVFNDCHLRRLLQNYVAYYHEDRTHLGLDKNTPAGREVERPPESGAKIVSLPRVGGLHHRYAWQAAA